MLVPLLTSKSVNFHNLVNLICHLLIGGQFQVAQVLYTPGLLNHSGLLSEIQRNCGDKIQWETADITQPKNSQWNDPIFTSNRFVQLVFTGDDREFVRNQLKNLYPNYYRLFIFQSNIDETPIPKLLQRKSFDSKTNSIALVHQNDSIQVFLMNDDLSLFDDQIRVDNYYQSEKTIESKELFEIIFGKREEMRVIGIWNPKDICLAYKEIWRQALFHQFMERFLFNRFNINFGRGRCGFHPQYFRHIPQSIYNEINWSIEEVSM